MPKRQKAKVRTTPIGEKAKSPAKLARIAKQQLQENYNRNIQYGETAWQTAKNTRHVMRKLQGKTYENWRRNNSARFEESKPTASNLIWEDKH